MEPYTGERLSCEIGEAIPAITRRAAALPAFLIAVEVGSCCACFSAIFAALGFLGVDFCREDMMKLFVSWLSTCFIQWVSQQTKAKNYGYAKEHERPDIRT
jgi:hypothetical protein